MKLTRFSIIAIIVVAMSGCSSNDEPDINSIKDIYSVRKDYSFLFDNRELSDSEKAHIDSVSDLFMTSGIILQSHDSESDNYDNNRIYLLKTIKEWKSEITDLYSSINNINPLTRLLDNDLSIVKVDGGYEVRFNGWLDGIIGVRVYAMVDSKVYPQYVVRYSLGVIIAPNSYKCTPYNPGVVFYKFDTQHVKFNLGVTAETPDGIEKFGGTAFINLDNRGIIYQAGIY